MVTVPQRFYVLPADASLTEVHRILDFAVERDGGHTSPCWHHTGQVDKDSYARVKFRGKTRRAARIIFTVFKGEIPEGHEIDHLCCNRRCINPLHLESVTKQENQRRVGERRRQRKQVENAGVTL